MIFNQNHKISIHFFFRVTLRLLKFMESYEFAAPETWKGHRDLDDFRNAPMNSNYAVPKKKKVK